MLLGPSVSSMGRKHYVNTLNLFLYRYLESLHGVYTCVYIYIYMCMYRYSIDTYIYIYIYTCTAPESGPARAATLSPPEVATVRSHGAGRSAWETNRISMEYSGCSGTFWNIYIL